MGNIDFLISVFTTLEVEEKLDQGALEPCSFASVNGEAGAREACTIVKADDALIFREVEVITSFDESRLFTPASKDGVGFFVGAHGAVVVGKIWNVEEKFGLALGRFATFVVESFDLLSDFLTSVSMPEESSPLARSFPISLEVDLRSDWRACLAVSFLRRVSSQARTSSIRSAEPS